MKPLVEAIVRFAGVCACAAIGAAPLGAEGVLVPGGARLADLDGDGVVDRLRCAADGALVVELNRGGRLFAPVLQELPRVRVADLLVTDLDGDGASDLYLVSPGANVALLGDGTGLFVDATQRLGLADAGRGLSAERVELDGRAPAELVLHNAGEDVIFWATGGAFEREGSTPERAWIGAAPLVPTLGRPPVVDTPDASGSGTPGNGRGPRVRAPLPIGRESVVPDDSPRPGPDASPSGPDVQLLPDPSGLFTLPPSSSTSAGLTPEQREILAHLSIEYLPDGLGGTVKTIRVSEVNLQVVNGTDDTETANGLGNLIVGYNELGNPGGDDRTGSHNVVSGKKHTYTSHGGLVTGQQNTLSNAWAVAAGGLRNLAFGFGATVLGGRDNTATGTYASVRGGSDNSASYSYTSVTGGEGNTASDFYASVTGGEGNTANFDYASVTGGHDNVAGDSGVSQGTHASVTGGRSNTASAKYASVSGGGANLATGYETSVSGGQGNFASGSSASVSGGFANQALGSYASVSGGNINVATGDYASISGGQDNTASDLWSSISGGSSNTAGGAWSSVSGGFSNTASGGNASVGGGQGNTASGNWAAVSGGESNLASWDHASVSGGYGNTAGNDGTTQGTHASVTGGSGNQASNDYASIGGGRDNLASGRYASVTGGGDNIASGILASISAGLGNDATWDYASVSGGQYNTASAGFASVCGGQTNIADGVRSTIGGGIVRTVTGDGDWRAGTLWEDD